FCSADAPCPSPTSHWGRRSPPWWAQVASMGTVGKDYDNGWAGSYYGIGGTIGTLVTAWLFAPIFHVRPDAPPPVLVTGDRELEILGRY
ncbi:MAG: hypothetical protein VCA18_07180, partial [Opitutales bacterium]